jgi:hypothetical protein
MGRSLPIELDRFHGLSISPRDAIGLVEAKGFIDAIDESDRFVLMPTEDPLYFATGRRSPIKLVQTLDGTGGDRDTWLACVRDVRPEFLLIKKQCQFFYWTLPSEISVDELPEYEPYRELSLYFVLKRK